MRDSEVKGSLFDTYLNVGKNIISENSLDSQDRLKNCLRSAIRGGRLEGKIGSLTLELVKISLAKSPDPRFFLHPIREVLEETGLVQKHPNNGSVIQLFPQTPPAKDTGSSDEKALNTALYYIYLLMDSVASLRSVMGAATPLKEFPPLIHAMDVDASTSVKHLILMYEKEGKLIDQLESQQASLKPINILPPFMLLPVEPMSLGYMPSIRVNAFQYGFFEMNETFLKETLPRLSEESAARMFSNLLPYLRESTIHTQALNLAAIRGQDYLLSVLSFLEDFVFRSGKTMLDVALENTSNFMYYLAMSGNGPAILKTKTLLSKERMDEELFPVIGGKKRNLLSLLIEKGVAEKAHLLLTYFSAEEELCRRMLTFDSPFFYLWGKGGEEERSFLDFALKRSFNLGILQKLMDLKKEVGQKAISLKRHLEDIVKMPLERYLVKITEGKRALMALYNDDERG